MGPPEERARVEALCEPGIPLCRLSLERREAGRLECAVETLDRQLLNIIQTDFPVDARPYEVLGERLGIAASEALAGVRRLMESGVIRKVGPSFDTRKLGHVSVLAAMRVPEAELAEVADVVGSYSQVTHNYGRDHEYNLWFTLVCENQEEVDRVAAEIKARTGIEDMRLLPAERVFKIRVDFEF